MSKKEKLVERFLKMHRDFHFNEMVKLLGYFDFQPVKKGKTSGSRVKFARPDEEYFIGKEQKYFYKEGEYFTVVSLFLLLIFNN